MLRNLLHLLLGTLLGTAGPQLLHATAPGSTRVALGVAGCPKTDVRSADRTWRFNCTVLQLSADVATDGKRIYLADVPADVEANMAVYLTGYRYNDAVWVVARQSRLLEF